MFKALQTMKVDKQWGGKCREKMTAKDYILEAAAFPEEESESEETEEHRINDIGNQEWVMP